MKTVQHWEHGKRHGAFIDYHENGKKSLEIHYINDKVSGLSIRYSEDGDTLSTIQFRDSRQHGLSKAFHNNNKVAAIVEFVDGFEEGKDLSYYENGQVKHKGQNHLGVKTGIWYYYSEVGELLKVEHWEKGKVQSVDSTFTSSVKE